MQKQTPSDLSTTNEAWILTSGSNLDWARKNKKGPELEHPIIIAMASLGCQFDCIWNEPKPTLPGLPVRDLSWLDHSWWEDLPHIWTTPSSHSLHKDREEGSPFPLPVALFLAAQFSPSPTLELTTSGFWCMSETTWVIQPHRPNSYWLIGLSVGRQLWLEQSDHWL